MTRKKRPPRTGRKAARAKTKPETELSKTKSKDESKAKKKSGPAKRSKAAPAPAPAASKLEQGLEVELGPMVRDADLPRCAIVVLNLNGKQHLKGLFHGLQSLDYPEDRFEVLMIDNGSTDTSVDLIRTDYPWVKLTVNERNVGFSAGCNQGAAAADGAEVLVFLNNDIRVEPDWLRQLVAPLVRGECQATTAKMYSWDGQLMNSAGGGMNFHGIGIQRGYLEQPGADYDRPRRTLFACGGAMAIDTEVFQEVGGFDDEFFAYYEDVDLGWRMCVFGHDIWYVPDAVCYHHHSSTSRNLPAEMIRLLQVRNPLLACFKNYDEENLKQILPALMSLALRRMYVVAGLEDTTPFRIEEAQFRATGPVRRLWEKARAATGDTVPLKRMAAADLIGINDLLGHWDHWLVRRAEVQKKRRRTDEEIFKLFLKPLWCIEQEPGYRSLQKGLESMLGLDELFAGFSVPGPDPHN